MEKKYEKKIIEVEKFNYKVLKMIRYSNPSTLEYLVLETMKIPFSNIFLFFIFRNKFFN